MSTKGWSWADVGATASTAAGAVADKVTLIGKALPPADVAAREVQEHASKLAESGKRTFSSVLTTATAKLDEFKQSRSAQGQKANASAQEQQRAGGLSWKGVGTSTAAGVVAVKATLVGVGFGPTGVTAGSLAAGMQAGIGNVAAGSVFAGLQSMGAGAVLGWALPGAAVGAGTYLGYQAVKRAYAHSADSAQRSR